MTVNLGPRRGLGRRGFISGRCGGSRAPGLFLWRGCCSLLLASEQWGSLECRSALKAHHVCVWDWVGLGGIKKILCRVCRVRRVVTFTGTPDVTA